MPVLYRLKFSGEVRLPGDFGSGFSATLSNFFLGQDATGDRTLSDLSGVLPTDCFGTIEVQPSTSLSSPPGALCPLTGQFTVNGSSTIVTYEGGEVVVDQMGHTQRYANCRAEELQMCLPQ